MKNPEISIIVPSKNSATSLTRFFESCLRSDYRDFEVVVNNDPSSQDDTAAVVKEYCAKGLTITLIDKNKSMAQARKVGARYSKGQILVHLDSDMEITPMLLGEILKKINSGYEALVIPEESFGNTFWAKCKWLEKKCYMGVEEIESLRCIKGVIYRLLGGHDAKMVFSEDKDFDIRVRDAGYRIGRVDSLILHNEGDLTIKKTFSKKLGYSSSANLFASKHPNHFRWQRNPLNRYVIYIRNIRYLFQYPFLYLGMIWLKNCEYIAGAFGLIIGGKRSH